MSPGRFQEAIDPALSEYHPWSRWAIAGLLLGLCSALAWLAPIFWILPALGVVCSIWGLRQTGYADYSGRGAAVAGLLASLLLGSAGISRTVSYDLLLRNEAKTYADRWFQHLREGRLAATYEMTRAPHLRQPSGISVTQHYESNPDAAANLDSFEKDGLVQMLLRLDRKAEIRYRFTEGSGRRKEADLLSLIYAVTYPHQDDRLTYLIRLSLRREIKQGRWHIDSYEGGVKPYAKSE